MLKSPLSTHPVIEALEARIAPATFTVTTTADSGPGSLRQAILDANALAGADSIGFDIPGDQLQVIALTSPLPAITETLTISNLSEQEKVRLDGSGAGPDAIGLRLVGTSGSVIVGLEIANFSGTGVLIDTGTENILQKNTIFSNGGHGVHVLGGSSNRLSGNTIGKSATTPGSVGNSLDGVLIENSQNNAFRESGSTAATFSQPTNTITSNGLFGIEIRGGGGGNEIAGVVISENGGRANSLVEGGGIAILNSPGSVGVNVSKWNPRTQQFDSPAGNWITNNSGHGVLISHVSSGTIEVLNNTINGNSGDGIHVDNSPGVKIGDESANSANVISGNRAWGISIVNQSAGAKVVANSIRSNSSGGILVDNSSFTTIGTLSGRYEAYGSAGNVIAFNSGTGVTIRNSFAVKVTENFFQQGFPVDLDGDGPTPNDAGDRDTGANGLLNYPIVNASYDNGWTDVAGIFETDTPNRQYRLQYYLVDPVDNTHKLVDFREVTTDNSGRVEVGSRFYTRISEGRFVRDISVVAIDLTTGNTSEFSPLVHLNSIVSAPSLEFNEGNAGGNTGSLTLSLNAADTIPITVHYRTVDGTAKAGEDYQAVEGTVTFAPGETTKSIPITWFGDTTEEATEQFYIDFSDVQGATVRLTGKATIWLKNDDGIPVISSYGTTVIEGSSGPGNPTLVQFTVSLNKPSMDPIFGYLSFGGSANSSNSSAGNPQDYSFTSSGFSFDPGATSYTGTITIFDDSVAESKETIRLDLNVPSGAATIGSQGIITILDNDSWQLKSSPVEISEGNDGQTLATITVYVDPIGPGLLREHSITVHYSTVSEGRPGEASRGSDYEFTEGTLTFAPGENSKTISVPILGDTVAEANEFIEVAFSQLSGAVLVTPRAKITVNNDDLPTLSVSGSSILEGNSGEKLLVFTAVLSNSVANAITVDYSTADGTATAGSDYTAVSGTLTFAPGETTKTVSVPVQGDTVQEADEILSLMLSNASGASLATMEVYGVIADDDFSESLPVLSVTNASVTEGHSGTNSLVFTFNLSKASASPVSVQYGTVDGTALASSDYTAVSGTLTFAPGETTKTVSVPVQGDTVQEANETLSLMLSNASGASLATMEVHGVIADDDSSESLPVLSVTNASVIEGHFGTSDLVFTFNLSKASASPVSVQYGTADGTALAGSDYTAVSGTLTFAPGETTKTVSVQISGELLIESSETLRLLLSGVTGATLVQDKTTGIILNDDISPDANLVISKGGRKVTWTDSDGDLVTLVATKPVLTLSSFHFGSADGSDDFVLEQLDATFHGNAKALGLSFSVKKSATGDGLVNVGEIDATGRDLTTISLPGRLGAIQAGDTNLKTPAIRKLSVNSFGMDSATAQAGAAPLLSEVKGSISSFAVKQDFTGANLVVSGGSVGTLVIGGNLEGISSAAPSGISIEKNLSNLKVGGDVSHANVLAGTGSQAGAHVGQVLVKGNWSASNLAVGAGAGPDGYFGTEDDIALQDTASRIARITIRGAVSGTAEAESATDHFGFVAGRIAAFQVGTQKFGLSSKWREMMIVGTASEDVTLCELAGPSRS